MPLCSISAGCWLGKAVMQCEDRVDSREAGLTAGPKGGAWTTTHRSGAHAARAGGRGAAPQVLIQLHVGQQVLSHVPGGAAADGAPLQAGSTLLKGSVAAAWPTSVHEAVPAKLYADSNQFKHHRQQHSWSLAVHDLPHLASSLAA